MRQIIIDAENLKLTKFYHKIKDTERRLKKLGLDSEEANEEAWFERKYALKIFIRENKDELIKWVFPGSEEEDEEEEEEEESE